MSTTSDAVLVDRCLRGELQAFETLVARYERQIFNAAYRIVGNYEDACDVTQQTFVKVYENLGKYRPQFKFFSWIYRIAMNEALDQVKVIRRMQSVESPSQTAPPNPEETLLDSETSKAVQEALLSLSPDLRAIVVLRHFHDLSYREMAHMLKIAEKTVKSRLYTARQKLAPLLRKAGVVTNE